MAQFQKFRDVAHKYQFIVGLGADLPYDFDAWETKLQEELKKAERRFESQKGPQKLLARQQCEALREGLQLTRRESLFVGLRSYIEQNKKAKFEWFLDKKKSYLPAKDEECYGQYLDLLDDAEQKWGSIAQPAAALPSRSSSPPEDQATVRDAENRARVQKLCEAVERLLAVIPPDASEGQRCLEQAGQALASLPASAQREYLPRLERLRKMLTGLLAPPPPPPLPKASITAPGPDAEFGTADAITVQADAEAVAGVQHIEFFANDLSLGPPLTQPPYRCEVRRPTGNYSLTAVVTDRHGQRNKSAEVHIKIKPAPPMVRLTTLATKPPTVRITRPNARAKFLAAQTIVLEAQADPLDEVSQIEFFANNTGLGPAVVQPPYRCEIRKEPRPYEVTAEVIDRRGQKSKSAPVENGLESAEVRITAPAANTSFLPSQTIVIEAGASSAAGIAQVEFFANNVSLGPAVVRPPYRFETRQETGRYELTAEATNTCGQKLRSAGVRIQVQPKTEGDAKPKQRRPSLLAVLLLLLTLAALASKLSLNLPTTRPQTETKALSKPTPEIIPVNTASEKSPPLTLTQAIPSEKTNEVVPVPAPKPLPPTAELQVVSLPQADEVRVNNHSYTSPKIQLDHSGDYEVAVARAGYRSVATNIYVELGQHKIVDFGRLEKESFLAIFTEPSGAEISLDGQVLKQTSPIYKWPVESGSHIVEARKGYLSVGRGVLVGEGSTGQVSLTFSDLAMAQFDVTSQPKPEVVMVNNQTNPYSSEIVRQSGDYTLTVLHSGYRPTSTNLHIELGERKVVDFGHLAVGPSAFRISSTPASASVSVFASDGSRLGFGLTPAKLDLAPGIYTAKVEAEDYLPVVFQISVRAGDIAETNVTLRSALASLRIHANPGGYQTRIVENATKSWSGTDYFEKLPASTPLRLVITAPRGYAGTESNLTLQPGERREFYLGQFAEHFGWLLVSCATPETKMSYSVDGTSYLQRAVGRIEHVPLDSLVSITVHRDLYADKTTNIVFTSNWSGHTVNFGRLEEGTLTLMITPCDAVVTLSLPHQADQNFYAPCSLGGAVAFQALPIGVPIGFSITHSGCSPCVFAYTLWSTQASTNVTLVPKLAPKRPNHHEEQGH